MSGRMLLAVLITALGAAITLVNLRNGLAFSFPLVLGLLLLADGVLRFSMLSDHDQEPVERRNDVRGLPAVDATDRPARIGVAPAAPDGVTTRTPLPLWARATDEGESPVGAAHEPGTRPPHDPESFGRPAPDLRTDPEDEAARPQPD